MRLSFDAALIAAISLLCLHTGEPRAKAGSREREREELKHSNIEITDMEIKSKNTIIGEINKW